MTRKRLPANLAGTRLEGHRRSIGAGPPEGGWPRTPRQRRHARLQRERAVYKDADSQRYYPWYAVDDTIETPALLAQNVGTAGVKGQTHGAMGAGYLPATEVPSAGDVSPAARQCRQMVQQAGEVRESTYDDACGCFRFPSTQTYAVP